MAIGGGMKTSAMNPASMGMKMMSGGGGIPGMHLLNSCINEAFGGMMPTSGSINGTPYTL